AIDPVSGKLTYIASSPLADSMAYLSTDRTGRFLLGASYPGHKLTVNPIEPRGTVHPPQQGLPNYPHAHSILVDADNRYVLAPTLGDDRVNVFRFDETTGMLEPNTPPAVLVKAKTGPRHLVFHPNGMLVYVLGERDGAISVFDYQAGTGQLTAKQTVSALPPHFQGTPLAAHLHITPPGRFLYASASPPTADSSMGRSARRAPLPASESTRPRARSCRSGACSPKSNRAASTSTLPDAICWRLASSLTRCRVTRSTRTAGSSPSSTNTR